MNKLADKHCKPCEGGFDVLPPGKVSGYLQQLEGWRTTRVNALMES